MRMQAGTFTMRVSTRHRGLLRLHLKALPRYSVVSPQAPGVYPVRCRALETTGAGLHTPCCCSHLQVQPSVADLDGLKHFCRQLPVHHFLLLRTATHSTQRVHTARKGYPEYTQNA